MNARFSGLQQLGRALMLPIAVLPIAGLLADLKSRGLLDTTLVMWHGEFGRMPISQRGVGRDHNPGAMTVRVHVQPPTCMQSVNSVMVTPAQLSRILATGINAKTAMLKHRRPHRQSGKGWLQGQSYRIEDTSSA